MKRITFLLIFIYCLTACNNELENENESENRISLFFPDAVSVNVYSVATPSECRIDTVWVLVFNSSDALIHSEIIDGSKISNNGQATQLLPELSSFTPANGNRIICIANSDADSNTDLTGITPDNINQYFELEKHQLYSGDERLPMYGEIMDWSSSYTCEMVRAVAKIQVRMGENVEDVTGSFNAETITWGIYHYPSAGGYVQPVLPIEGISVPGPDFYGAYDLRLMQKTGVADAMKTVYIYEYPSGTKDFKGGDITPGSFNKNRVCLLLAKITNTMDTSYYRLDFYDPLTKEYLDIKRNHHYIFTINKVKSEGYTGTDSIYEALSNPGSNIEYTVTVSENWALSTHSNGQYGLSVSRDTIFDASIPFLLKAQIPTGVETQITKHTINIYDRNGTPVGSTGSDLEVAGYPSASSGISYLADGLTTTTLNFTVNDDTWLDSAEMIIRLGNIRKRVPIILWIPTKILISIPDVGTINNATDAEAAFYTADVFIYDDAALEKHVHFLSSEFTHVPGAAGVPSRYELISPFEVNSGSKRIFVGINLSPTAVEAVKNGFQAIYTYQPIPALPASQTALRDSIARGSGYGFAMFNVKDSVYTILPDVENPQGEHKNEFVIEVSRWVAKATMRKDAGLNNTATGATFLINDAGGLSFCMGNVNTRMYPLQKRSAVGDSIVDPNFASGLSSYNTHKTEFVNDFGGNTPYIVATAYVDVNLDTAPITARNNKYTVENTSRAPYLQGLMSYISVRAKFIPDSVPFSMNSEGILTLVSNSAVQNNLSVYVTAGGKYLYFTNGSGGTAWATHPNNAGNRYLGRYLNAYCYYLIYLDPKGAYLKAPYASIRNFYYDTRITSITALGYPEPEEPDPGNPLTTSGSITVDVMIEGWTLVPIPYEIGEV